ncbi:hypothetical protein CEW46_24665 [Bacillus cereus]|nr:hypothetical protein CEW46_24665 [Bacillus cereus]
MGYGVNPSNLSNLMGRLVKDPVYKEGPKSRRTTFKLAVRRTPWNPNSQVDFIPIVVWDDLAEKCRDALLQGDLIAVVGALRSRTYQNQHKMNVFEIELEAEQIIFIQRSAKNNPEGKDLPQFGLSHKSPSANDQSQGLVGNGSMGVPLVFTNLDTKKLAKEFE